jgi:hypothetical protein
MSTTPYAILGLLSIEPMSGYDIRANLEESLAHFWSESYGQIYPRSGSWRPAADCSRQARTPGFSAPETLHAYGRGARTPPDVAGEPPKPQPPRMRAPAEAVLRAARAARRLRRASAEAPGATGTAREHLEGLERQLKAERRGHPDLRYWLMAVSFGIERAQSLIDWSEFALRELGRRLTRIP